MTNNWKRWQKLRTNNISDALSNSFSLGVGFSLSVKDRLFDLNA